MLTPGARKVTDLARVATEGGFDLVVNCTGVWAGQLAGDDKVRPYRGQVQCRIQGENRHSARVMTCRKESVQTSSWNSNSNLFRFY